LVIGIDIVVYLDGNQIDFENALVLGTNKDLNNKKLKIIHNVIAENETPCVFSVT